MYNYFFIRKACFYKIEVVQIIFQRKKDSRKAALSHSLFLSRFDTGKALPNVHQLSFVFF